MNSSPHRVILARRTTRFDGFVVLSRDWPGDRDLPPLTLAAPARLRRLFRPPPWRWARYSGYFMEDGSPVFLLPRDILPAPTSVIGDIRLAGPFNDWSPDASWTLRPKVREGEPVLELPVTRPARPLYADESGCDFKFVTSSGQWLEPPTQALNRVQDTAGNFNYHLNPARGGHHVFCFVSETPADLSEHDIILWTDASNSHATPVAQGDFLLRQCSNLEPGAHVQNNKTLFRIFAPRATQVTLELWPRENDNASWHERLALIAREDGIWEIERAGDLHGWRYQYYIQGENADPSTAFDHTTPILDPWALAALSPRGPGLIVNTDKISFPKTLHSPPAPTDAIIMEAHLRDLLGHSPDDNRPTGFKELAAWIRSPDCYLRKIGVNVLELQPIQEFDAAAPGDYHWGYMPVNWFAPASAYAGDPSSGSQIADFQELVAECHNAGIAVVLDVVYNHLGEPNPLLRIDKGYYLETASDGGLSNWSGCGNDIRPNTPMMRRLILASLRHLVECYDIDGFRFDLAELLGMPLLHEIVRELRPLKPGLLLIAEPWSFRGHLGRALAPTKYISWNDHFRDYFPAWAHGTRDAGGLRYFLSGSPSGENDVRPDHTLNYTESHDDYCWLDRITENPANDGTLPTENDARRTRLVMAATLASLGVPMLAAGQDFLRTKTGVSNTYLRGDLNALDYARLAKFHATHEYVRNWIAFRLSQAGAAFRLREYPQEGFFLFFGKEGTGALAALYNANGKTAVKPLFVAFNPENAPVELSVPGVDPAGFRQLANGDHFCDTGLPPEATFTWQSGKLTLPALSASLWTAE